jgi:hypothetical protein
MLKQGVSALVLAVVIAGCGSEKWVYFNPPPLAHAHYYWKAGIKQNGGCRFTTALSAGEEEDEIEVNTVTCRGYFQRGDAPQK